MLSLASSCSCIHHCLPCSQSLPIPPDLAQQPNSQPACTPPTVACAPLGAQIQEPQAEVGVLALCYGESETRMLSWFLVFNGGRLGQAGCPGGSDGEAVPALPGGMGIPGCEGQGKTSKAGKAPGRLSQHLEHCCPLVATLAATNCPDFRKQFSAACTCLSFPVGDRHARLLQGLHQGLIGLNTDLDLSPCCLIRCTRQLRLCLLQVGPGCP